MALKKLISACLLPFPIALALLICGLLLLWFTQRQRLGSVLSSLSVLIFLIGGYDLFSGAADPAAREPVSAAQRRGAGGDDAGPDRDRGAGLRLSHRRRSLPPNDRLSANGIVRLTEAMRLARMLPSARLIVSDGVGQGECAGRRPR